tara:strand:+ start:114 stop:461 length:348 start_codon:yes stop_codon:yes gene_type:complete
MSKNSPTEPAKKFNMNTIKKGQDKKTEYIVSKKSNGVKYWKKLKSEEKKCLKDFEKKKKINLEEYKKGKYVSNKQALAVTYSQVLRKNPKCGKYIGTKTTKSSKKSQKKSQKKKK